MMYECPSDWFIDVIQYYVTGDWGEKVWAKLINLLGVIINLSVVSLWWVGVSVSSAEKMRDTETETWRILYSFILGLRQWC